VRQRDGETARDRQQEEEPKERWEREMRKVEKRLEDIGGRDK
jgi:hypothetical protein